MDDNNESILSISAFIDLINEKLSSYQAKIIGEVCNVSSPPSGHVYFTLKDKETGAVLDCIAWKSLYDLYGIKIEIGMELILTGHTRVYPARGSFSFIAKSIEHAGEGALLKAYNDLKIKLKTDGLLSVERKRQLPEFPTKIGIITSKNGAVIHDFMNNLNRHGIKITFINTKVEGQEALPDLYKALKTIKNRDLDIIVIMRGGGSIQSLAAFDNEKLVRELADSKIPTIAAIGHHQDVPLCALVADVTVSTPTAAANLINLTWEKAVKSLQSDQHSIIMGYSELLNDVRLTLELRKVGIFDKFKKIISILSSAEARIPKYMTTITKSIYSHKRSIIHYNNQITNHMNKSLTGAKIKLSLIGKEKLTSSFTYILKNSTDDINNFQRLINSYDPNRQLSLGYSLVRNISGKLVKSVQDVTIGESINLTISDGIISSKVESKINK